MLREEVAKVNELTGTITLARGCRPGSLNPMDSPEGTVVWGMIQWLAHR
jgi:hypothetical protein